VSAFLSSPKKLHTDQHVWGFIDDEDTWIFCKLIVARRAGHVCGSRGFAIPESGMYCVRPVTNFEGLSKNARIEYREKGDWVMDIHPGEFWVKKFNGLHVSVDYMGGEQVLTVAGYRNQSDPLYRFNYWVKEKHYLPLPKMLHSFVDKYPVINCEYIGGKLVEIHLRQNPDFLWGNTRMIPVWDIEQLENIPEGFRYIPDNPPEEKRLGILIDQ
jgi:hypothetical protein